LSLFLALILAIAFGSPSEVVSKIGFGSCMHQDDPQVFWQVISKKKPDFFILLGDNIYAKSISEKKMAYSKLDSKSTFSDFRKSVPIYAIWDDNDYGTSDSGAEFPFKKESKELFLDFFKVPKNSVRWGRDGIYDAVTFGPKTKKVQLLLLDTRTFRSQPQKSYDLNPIKRYVPNNDPKTSMLGEAQWQWLEEKLKEPANIRIIASGLQILPTQHQFESWNNFPHERKKMIELINKTNASGVILLSGDRHKASIMKISEGVKYPVYEVTSSGLTQTRPRKGEDEPDTFRVGSIYYGPNFGFINIDWEKATLELQILSESGESQLHQLLNINDLTRLR